MLYHIYVYQNILIDELDEIFDKLYRNIQMKHLNKSVLKILIHLNIDEELVDFDMIHASIVSDFGTDTKLLCVHQKTFDFIEEEYLIDTLSLLKNQVYDITKFLNELSRYPDKRHMIKRNLVNLLGQDYVKTIMKIAESNINFSIAAKKLYLHRNSLNYRLDKIYNKTGVEVKSFRGLRAFINIFDD